MFDFPAFNPTALGRQLADEINAATYRPYVPPRYLTHRMSDAEIAAHVAEFTAEFVADNGRRPYRIPEPRQRSDVQADADEYRIENGGAL